MRLIRHHAMHENTMTHSLQQSHFHVVLSGRTYLCMRLRVGISLAQQMFQGAFIGSSTICSCIVWQPMRNVLSGHLCLQHTGMADCVVWGNA